ncbi:MAG: methylated-DNA--[protein]-cysteine S-methyltransferase [Candidatus Pacebacteria bacterium]|nr:methylated-DNA--[protein]-cysteine S-methyltransferase [Candidatus Paceibacterota bacterium]
MYQAIVKTKLGQLQIIASDIGLVAIDLLDRIDDPEFNARRLAGLARLELDHPNLRPATGEVLNWVKKVEQLGNGEVVTSLPPLDLGTRGTAKQRQVWQNLLRIPRGQTITYGEMARRIGSPKGARAAGSACGANPLPIVIPCHRVVASDGSLGGFGLGLERKGLLLEWERG